MDKQDHFIYYKYQLKVKRSWIDNLKAINGDNYNTMQHIIYKHNINLNCMKRNFGDKKNFFS